MITIKIIYNPYDQKTTLYFDNQEATQLNNRLVDFVANRDISEWLNPYIKRYMVWDGVLLELVKEINDDELDIIFEGKKSDYVRLCEAFDASRQTLINEGYQNNWKISHVQNFEDEQLCQRVVKFIDTLTEFIETRDSLMTVFEIKKILQKHELLESQQIQEQIRKLEEIIEKRLNELTYQTDKAADLGTWLHLRQTLTSIRW